jgi:pyruvate dehydrogenase E1 component alpha subunit
MAKPASSVQETPATSADPALPGNFDAEKYLRFYEQMVISASSKNSATARSARAPTASAGYLHLYSGEEAIAVGIIGAMDVQGGTRSSGTTATTRTRSRRARPPGQVMAEICGKITGCSKGKGGSMHICDAKLGFYGGYGIVGGNVPIALGLGWKIKYTGGNQVCACFFGDGSMNQGGFHESLNMAQLYKVPGAVRARKQRLRDGDLDRALPRQP